MGLNDVYVYVYVCEWLNLYVYSMYSKCLFYFVSDVWLEI